MNYNKLFPLVLLIGFLLIFSMISVSSVSAANKNIYVDTNGNDTGNLGNSTDSPYATIDKAISVSGHSDVVTIHLSKGTFRGSGNSLITINNAHRTQGGNITIVGAGYNKTFIDGYYNSNIFDIKLDSVVILENLTFINCKSVNGGVITSSGNLKFVNCIFENNRAVTNGGVLYITSGTCSIYNSLFNNNSAATGGVIYFGAYSTSGSLIVNKSNFTNNYVNSSNLNQGHGGAIYSMGSQTLSSIIMNSIFINNSAVSNYHSSSNPNPNYINRGGSVYLGSGSLINNSFISSSIFGPAPQGSAFYIDVDGVYNAENNLRINCSINNVSEPNIYTPNYKGDYLEDIIHVYVSPNGSDVFGDGSKNSPYSTISKAIDSNVDFTKNLFIYLLAGNYTGFGNVKMNLPNYINLKISGYGSNNTFIDGEGINWIFKFNTTNLGFLFTLSNLTINNPVSYNKSGSENVGAIVNYCNFIIENSVFRNSIGSAISNEGNGNLTIINSSFINNSAANGIGMGSLGNVGGGIYNIGQYLAVFNSIFISNRCGYSGSAIYSKSDSNKITNVLLVNTTVYNSTSLSDDYVFGSAIFITCTNFTVINSNFMNNSIYDIVANGVYGNSSISLFNVIFNGSGGITSDSFRSDNINLHNNALKNVVWKVYNSNFIDLNNDLVFNCFGNVGNLGNVFSGNLFKGNFSLEILGTNTSNSVVFSNSTILTPIILGFNTSYNFNYNWWGNIEQVNSIFSFYNNDSSGSNITLDKWIVLSLSSDNSPGLSQYISLIFRVTNGTNIFDNYYDYDIGEFLSSLSSENFIFGSLDGNFSLISNNFLNNITYIYNTNKYGSQIINATIFNKTFWLDLDLYRLNSTTNINISSNLTRNNSIINIVIEIYDNGKIPINEGFVELFVDGNSFANVSVVNGKVLKDLLINLSEGEHNIKAVYNPSSKYFSSETLANFEVKSVKSQLNLNSSKSGKIGDKTLISVVVFDNDSGNPINKGIVEFYLGDILLGKSSINNGKVVFEWLINTNIGNKTLNTKFSGDGIYMPCETVNSFEVLSKEVPKSSTKIVINNFKGTYNKNTKLFATLIDNKGNPIAGKTVNFYINNKFVGKSITNSKGQATLYYKVRSTGVFKVKASFSGSSSNSNYNSSSNSNYSSSASYSTLSVSKLSVLKLLNKKSVKGKKITVKSTLANIGPNKGSFKIYIKLPKGLTYSKPKITPGKISYNKKTRILTWSLTNLKVNSKSSAILVWNLKAKKGKYNILPSFSKVNTVNVIYNNVLKNIKVK